MGTETVCSWVVFERKNGFGGNHGPERFSLLYLCADGAAVFQVLFHANKIAPKIITIIQPGHGFGGNYTNFEDPKQILGRSVLSNPAGKPDYLLFGGIEKREFYEQSCWPEYSSFINFLPNVPGGNIGIWERSSRV